LRQSRMVGRGKQDGEAGGVGVVSKDSRSSMQAARNSRAGPLGCSSRCVEAAAQHKFRVISCALDQTGPTCERGSALGPAARDVQQLARSMEWLEGLAPRSKGSAVGAWPTWYGIPRRCMQAPGQAACHSSRQQAGGVGALFPPTPWGSFHLPFTKAGAQSTGCLLDRSLSLEYLAVAN
jgi:hypothetical protein